MKLQGYFDFTHRDARGNIVWEEKDVPNNLFNAGELEILKCFLMGSVANPAPTNLYLRLYQDASGSETIYKAIDATVGEDQTLADMAAKEAPTQFGYAPLLVNANAGTWTSGDWTFSMDGDGSGKAVSATRTFTASGGSIGPINVCVLASSALDTDSATSFPIARTATSVSRTLADGESLDTTYTLKLQ